MRQVFKTRYTKENPNIRSWYGKGEGSSDIIVAYPSNIRSPFKGRDTISMDAFAEDNFEENLLFWMYSEDQTPYHVFNSLKDPNKSYEEVIL